MSRRTRLFILLIGAHAVAVVATACGSPTRPSTTVAVQGVKVTPQSIQFTAIGETRQLTASLFPTNATDRVVTWESTDPTIASVDANGLVTARAVGFDVFITAVSHDGHHEASVAVNVNP